ncbi:MAG: hypothetical protein QY331_07735 [Melioribacteraceae bacterium]|nr:MAG: hypothetical protein QY331_07735 [Melioribacteraceae bacterium]
MKYFKAILLLKGTPIRHYSGTIYKVGLNIVVDDPYVVIPVYNDFGKTQDLFKNFEVLNNEIHQSDQHQKAS